MKTILTVPGRPISVNHLYSTGRSRYSRRSRFVTKKGKKWKYAVEALYLLRCGQIMHMGSLTVFVEYFFPDKRRRDVTNYDKAILDALAGYAYLDDSQIVNFMATKSIDSKDPRTIVTIFSGTGEKGEITTKFLEILHEKNYREAIEKGRPKDEGSNS